jgi:hypothetical protein
MFMYYLLVFIIEALQASAMIVPQVRLRLLPCSSLPVQFIKHSTLSTHELLTVSLSKLQMNELY